MPKSFYTKLAGVSKKNEDGRRRQDVIEEDIYEGLELHLEREPDNPHDSDAIAVFSSVYGDKVGYISGDLADQLAPQMDRGQLITCQVAEITGDYGQTRGVNVLITVYTLAETKELDEAAKIDRPTIEPAAVTEEPARIPEAPKTAIESQKPAEEVPQPSSQVYEWRATKAYTPPPVLRAIEPKRKLTLKQRWLALPKKARTWIIVIAIILLLYLCSLLTSCTPQIQEVIVTQIHTQEIEVTREIDVTRLVVVTATPLMPTPTSTFQKWSYQQAQQAIAAAGLEFESTREMTKDDYGLAPMNALEGYRFIIPSLCADCGGRLYIFDDPQKLGQMKEYYDGLAEVSAMYFSWVFVQDNILIQINGDLPEAQALQYQQALVNMK